MFPFTTIKGYSRKLVLYRWQKSKQNATSSQLLARSLLQTSPSPASPLTGPFYRGVSPPQSCPPLHCHLARRSMATSQLYGSGLVAKRSMRSLESLRPSLLSARVSSSDSVDLKSMYFRVPALRVSYISGRKLSVTMCLNETSAGSSVEANNAIRYAEGTKPDLVYEPLKSNPTEESFDGKMGMDMRIRKEGIMPTKRSAKLHDFCFGIPFGGFLFAGGLLDFIFSRNATAMIHGGAILVLSVLSLKVWRTGRSSLPFILGQAAFSAAFLWKLMQAYTLCCNDMLLFICVDLRRKPTTEEVGSSSPVISHENLYKKTLYEHEMPASRSIQFAVLHFNDDDPGYLNRNSIVPDA
ncbi:hypothetical protein MUK42_35941 [Musa troglodytarum]|uniref:Protein FATTY ACID EXPORT 1, chloroplastic n=1 Tax=Musa troglodytarum TaxID=320322 RepID=A0A9E7L5Y0_9LILI|nr:hypothetical protein MUK42_35941 [Musa troglodytarum]URE39236.1 hypothetical protein MUK42_35941 [Musa troglodytarum]